MAEGLKRRLAALEGRRGISGGEPPRMFLMPRGLDAEGEARWHSEIVAPVLADGDRVIVIRFVAPNLLPSLS